MTIGFPLTPSVTRHIVGVGMVCTALLVANRSFSQEAVPNALLEVAVRQKEDGKISQGIHRLELSCFGGQCALTTVTLNQCTDIGGGTPAFYPKVERSFTSEGSLTVRNQGRTLIVRQSGSDFGGDYVINYRFEYAAAARGSVVSQVVGFSGGLVKDSSVTGKVYTMEYVPLPEQFQIVPLDCGVWLPGVVSNTPKAK